MSQASRQFRIREQVRASWDEDVWLHGHILDIESELDVKNTTLTTLIVMFDTESSTTRIPMDGQWRIERVPNQPAVRPARCMYSQDALIAPARSRSCKHASCMNYNALLHHIDLGNHTCPVAGCSARMSMRMLVTDGDDGDGDDGDRSATPPPQPVAHPPNVAIDLEALSDAELHHIKVEDAGAGAGGGAGAGAGASAGPAGVLRPRGRAPVPVGGDGTQCARDVTDGRRRGAPTRVEHVRPASTAARRRAARRTLLMATPKELCIARLRELRRRLKGVKGAALRGWTATGRQRRDSTQMDFYYRSPAGDRFRSKVGVMRFLKRRP